ncbi:SulP family inorganic anion transporter [Martelella mediterranea]|uniref:Dicarboxylic acid uptake system A n=1 Tax=Martelella mediterranea DSM 17316 TaxID=1122214 RepID=A0A1U9Z483_9HYPH|nr:SulP family inorganic anion transporter [Martelella mediterranea]AQZ52517.1 Dicarboxylic acid uptake system A [Martelella mediterranea DSM 17316]
MPTRLVPKTVSVLREGYSFSRLKGDAISGLTVAIVALPLSMAIAIASGVSPDRGLYAAIIGGFFVSLLGGSRHQIGGPAGAFIVLVAASVERNGIDGLIIAVILSGLIMIAAGYLKLGAYIRFIPYPVTVGFTAGIAIIIFASQLSAIFGLDLPGKEPGPFAEKVAYLAQYVGTTNISAVAIAVLTIAIIIAVKRFRPGWPGMLIAVAVATLAAFAFNLPVETIGSQFGGLPRGLQAPALPALSVQKVISVLPDAFAFALLGSIESLLSAVVADGMTGRRHRSNMELVGQGVANIASGLFGGICVTGTIARTATNVRAGATSPFSGMLHSLFLLLFMIVAAPLARFIPLATLAGVLAVVAWTMVEKAAIRTLLRTSRGDAVILLVTLLLVVFRDLTEGIVAGFALGAVMFIDRMGKNVAVNPYSDYNAKAESPIANTDPDTVVYRISGAFFFGAAATVGSVLDRVAGGARNFVLDLSDVPYVDSSAANVLEGTIGKAEHRKVRVLLAGATQNVRSILESHGISEPRVAYCATLDEAAARIEADKNETTD